MACVLVIDDEPMVRQVVRRLLESAGHKVLEAENGHGGLEYLRRHRPQVVITDIIMPGKEGIETIIEMKQMVPDLRIIAISGGGRTGNLDFLKLARKLGACAALSKPFDNAELLKAVDDAVSTTGADP